MDTRTGELYDKEALEKMRELPAKYLEYIVRITEEEAGLMEATPTDERPRTLAHFRKNKYRNRPCPCLSGKKFKKCCANKTDKEILALLGDLKNG